jgi:dGTPase
MDWERLLQPYRLGCAKDICGHGPDRSEFQIDFDRVVFSTIFRRLNGKTQVFPFPETDVIHTRLTHSLEAASVGRSLGAIVGNELHKKGRKVQGWELGAVVSVACLAHDIGNPPLGHSGEKAIAEFFDSERGREIISELSKEQKADFLNFEGNAMGLHLLTYSNPHLTTVSGGLGLTYPAIAAFAKYPRTAHVNGDATIASEKKAGVFQYDIATFSEVATELGIPAKVDGGGKWFRHPLAFLTEAADDICYSIMDFEDGYKHGLVSYEETSLLLIKICEAGMDRTSFGSFKKIIDKRQQIGYLRAKAINSLIYQLATAFIDNEAEILGGTFDRPLFDVVESNLIVQDILRVSKDKIYCHRPVLEVEAAGFQVLSGLLDSFLFAIKNPKKASSERVLRLVPKEYIFDFSKDPYGAILSITNYIAGMTDTFAVDTFRNLRGIQLPNY